MTASRDYGLKIRAQRRWTEVYAEHDGENVSHLGYAANELQIGPEASVRMAGIGGVGTDREHRRRGLARKVFRRALEEMAREGYATVGLYTSRAIVAHRLYRRFGLVDLVPNRHYVKLLDPGRAAQKMLKELVLRSEELRSRRLTIRFCIGCADPLTFRIEGNEVSLLSRASRNVDLTLALHEDALVKLAGRQITLRYAQDAKLVQWSGDAAVYAMLSRAIASQREPIHEG